MSPRLNNIKWNLFDIIIIAYCLVTEMVIIIFGNPKEQYFDEIIFYLSMAALTALIVYYVDEKKNRLSRFIRLFYPAFMFTFFYRETGGLMFLFFDSFFDYQITALEKFIFGFNPTLFIDKNMLNVFINELLSFCYFIYYLLIPLFMIYSYIKKDYFVIKSFLSATCITFFVSYWLFSLYPLEGPRWFFQHDYVNIIEGVVFRPLVEMVIGTAAVRGGCMPSSHFGVGLVILLYCFKYYKKLALYLTPVIIGLGMGTVWGRFHYVSDVIVGGLIGYFAVLLIWRFEKHTIDFELQTKIEEITI